MESYYQALKDHHWTELHDEVIVLHAGRGEYYSFSQVASLVWKKLQARVSLNDLVSAVCQEYSVSSEQCQEEISQFIKLLESDNFISEARLV